MAIYKGRWDCNYCGHSGNNGPSVHCTQCGGPRPEDVQFYLPSNARAISCEEELEAANAGPDWVCSNCNAGNKHWDQFCGSCGSPFRAADRDTILVEKEYEGSAVPRSSQQQVAPVKVTRRTGLSKVKRGGILTIILTALGSWIGTFNSGVNVEITGFEWNRVVKVQEFKEIEESDWALPATAILLDTTSEIHHHDKVFKGYETKKKTVREKVGTEQYVCGKKDLGNGYFEDKYCTRPVYEEREETYKEKVYEKIPVYQTKYQYRIKKWVDISSISTNGTDHSPKWGTRSELANTKRFRENGRSGTYQFQFQDHKGEKHWEKVDFDFWNKLSYGDQLPALKSRFYGYFKELDWKAIRKRG